MAFREFPISQIKSLNILSLYSGFTVTSIGHLRKWIISILAVSPDNCYAQATGVVANSQTGTGLILWF